MRKLTDLLWKSLEFGGLLFRESLFSSSDGERKSPHPWDQTNVERRSILGLFTSLAQMSRLYSAHKSSLGCFTLSVCCNLLLGSARVSANLRTSLPECEDECRGNIGPFSKGNLNEFLRWCHLYFRSLRNQSGLVGSPHNPTAPKKDQHRAHSAPGCGSCLNMNFSYLLQLSPDFDPAFKVAAQLVEM